MWILLILALLCVGETARRFVARLGLPPGPGRLVAWFVLGCSLFVAVGILVGAVIRSADAPTFVIGVAAVCALSIAISSRPRLDPSAPSTRPSWRDWVPAPPKPWFQRILLIAAAAEAVWLAVLAGLFPVFAYDSIRYHIAAAACWIRQGFIGYVETPSIFINTLPKNAEVVLMNLLLLGGSDRFVDLYQLPFWILACVSVYDLSRRLGADGRSALLASVLTFFTPMAICQCTTTYLDVVSASLFLMALDLLVAGTESPELRIGLRWLLLGGLAAGLMVGTKTDAIPRVILLAGFPLFASRKTIGTRAGQLAVFSAGALALGSYWYLDSWMRYGNPVYPLEIAFLGKTVFGGLQTPAEFYAGRAAGFQQVWWSLLDRDDSYSYDSAFAGYGPAFLCLFLPAAGVRLFRGGREGRRRLFFLVLLMVIPIALNPMRLPRFHLFLPGLGAVMLASLLPQLALGTRRLVEGLGVLCIASVMWCTPHQTFYGADDVRRSVDEGPLRPSEFLWGVDYDWAYRRDPADGAVAYAGDHLVYYLLGRRTRNRIVFIPPESEDKWLRRLREEKVALLWLGNIDDAPFRPIGAHRERSWAAERPRMFEEVLRNYAGVLYRVKEG